LDLEVSLVGTALVGTALITDGTTRFVELDATAGAVSVGAGSGGMGSSFFFAL
jgi:hypothetical protein